METQEKLVALRRLMKQAGVTALYVGTTDPHQTEQVASHWKAVQWLTGFTGSMGYAIVTENAAEFWTDGRYKELALRQIDRNSFHINSISDADTTDWDAWLMTQLKENDVLALDGEVTSEAMLRIFRKKLPVKGLRIDCSRHFVGEIWQDRPVISSNPVWEMPAEYAVENRREKLAALRERLKKFGADASTLVCGLDDVAWLTNLRGDDNPLYPFFHAYVWVDGRQALLFADRAKFSDAIRAKLAEDGWTLHDYREVQDVVESAASQVLYLDPFKTPFRLYESVPEERIVIDGPDLVMGMKARKSPGEQANIRKANRHECVALLRLMRWIEAHVAEGKLDEYAVGQKLEAFRRMSPLYLHPANVPIVGYGENAALPHYRPSAAVSARIRPEGFLLFDVAAQYICGTTDLTRTVAVGVLSEEMKVDYTITLKAHIKLARQKFPEGTTGNLLDAVVKAGHWDRCMTFGHGTGHGIGYVLNIHEGPAKIITEFAQLFPYGRETALEAGMLFSNEPGVYKPGRHGVRIENSVLVQKDEKTEFGQFLRFETVSFLPFEHKAIVREMLTDEEVAWINDYQHQVCENLLPMLTDDEAKWLREKSADLV